MRRPTPATPHPRSGMTVPLARAALALLAAVALGGCGAGATSTNGLTAAAPTPVAFKSDAINNGKLPALYTCDGRDISPPLAWGAVPSKVQELALFALGTRLNQNGQAALSIEWGMAGVKPGLHHLRAGEVPHGAFLVTGTAGRRRYSICPAKGHTARYSFVLLALPPGARTSSKFPGAALFQNLTSSSREYATPVTGAFPASYTRR